MTRREWMWAAVALGSAILFTVGAGIALFGAPWFGLVLTAAAIMAAAVALDHLDKPGWPP